MAQPKSYVEVQQLLSQFVKTAAVNIGGAPHHAFWETLTYDEFTTGNVPGVQPAFKILEKSDSANSTIIQILKGTGKAAEYFGQMPQPNPPYNPEQDSTVADLAAWIDAGCPKG